jgi:hypothetical protein
LMTKEFWIFMALITLVYFLGFFTPMIYNWLQKFKEK